MTPSPIPADAKSILLVRLSARGDLVFASPLVRAFKRSFPGATVTWLAEAHTKELIEHHPELDQLIVWDRHRWKKLVKSGRFMTLIREARTLVRELRAPRFDVAIDLQGLFRSGLMAFLSGAPIRLGLGSREGSRVLMTDVLDRYRGDRTKVGSEYRALAEHLGLEVGPFSMEVALSTEDQRFAENMAREMGLDKGYAVLVPFTTRPQKHWFEDRWARVADRLMGELDLPSVLVGGPSDKAAAERIAALAQVEVQSVVSRTSLTQAAAMIANASLVLGVDTGLSHISVAYNRPTVLIYGSNIPYTSPPSDRIQILVHWLECSPCKGNPTCNGEYTCLRLVTEDQVLDAATAALSNEAGPKEVPAP